MARFAYDIFWTALGWAAVLGSPNGLRRSVLPVATPREALDALGAEAQRADRDADAMAHARSAVLAALHGTSPPPEPPFDLEGVSPFFRVAWQACRSIPMGETRSYAWLAEAAGRPGAARAAGQAMARNRMAPLVPCHRVVASDGRLGGYGGGLALKERLLAMEAATAMPARVALK